MRRRPCFSLFRSEAGVSFVEALAAAGIFSIGVLGLSMSLVQMGKARTKTGIVNGAITLETLITEGIANQVNYPASPTRALIQAGNKSALTLTIGYQDTSGNGQTMVFGPMNAPNQLFFNKDLEPCAAASFADPDCVLMATVDFDPGPGAPFAPPAVAFWRAAYHVTINPSTEIAVGNFGAMTLPFGANDYRLPAPDLSEKTADTQSCDPATSVAVRGVNRDNGEVRCLLKPDPTNTCASDEIATRFESVGGQLVLDCATGGSGGLTARSFDCPDNYSLYRIPDPSVFDPRVTLTAANVPQCVYRAESTETVAAPPDAATINKNICPRPTVGGPVYQHSNVCTLVDNRVNGQCCTVAGCAASLIPWNATVPPTTSFSTSLDAVNCTVTANAQPAKPGACVSSALCPWEIAPSWTGVVRISPATVSCSLTLATTISATPL